MNVSRTFQYIFIFHVLSTLSYLLVVKRYFEITTLNKVLAWLSCLENKNGHLLEPQMKIDRELKYTSSSTETTNESVNHRHRLINTVLRPKSIDPCLPPAHILVIQLRVTVPTRTVSPIVHQVGTVAVMVEDLLQVMALVI